MNHFWAGRSKSTSYWLLFVNTTNLLYQINALFKPKTDIHELMAKVYIGCSILVYILIYVYYKFQKDNNYKLCLYLIFRNSIRIIDMEDTR